ncbi:winged helix-turn-helix protein [Halorubrum tailed virus 28]|uniref:Winged helix-turn-helix protein n=1 Tax=Halorubrum tailed virus 28 TaxID=2878009 RepID=A0AAE8XZC4_9CAUD|nr:winged helix-turn-helix protein [Halorubrum tailed virus 28]UBF23505.1 winged helix-turn-helix protein [Halorubrum tailed virus 28]
MTTDPWRYRCPEGHTSITTRTEGYYCQTCGAYYDGEPVDAKADNAPETDGGRTTPHALTAVRRLWQVTGDTDTTARARHVSDRSGAFTHALHAAEERGLVERVTPESNAPDRWRVTEDARWLVASPERGDA